jgi:mono/diheme cytochrome c family protein
MGKRGLLSLILAASVTGACASSRATPAAQPTPPPATAPASPPAGQGLYTTAQADRGQQVFGSICSACHGAAEFRGQMFQISWMAKPVGDLFQHISTAMPQDAPGSLTPEQYAAVIAYMMRMNGKPAGPRELPTDLKQLESLSW